VRNSGKNNTKHNVSEIGSMGNSEVAILRQAMYSPDDYAVRLRYRAKDGELTERVISPIKMEDSRSLLALCLCRENPRRFELERCSHIELIPAHEILMPMELKVIEAAPVREPKSRKKAAAV
jgi:predicted DNA-binding transcriptional regulator YafY